MATDAARTDYGIANGTIDINRSMLIHEFESALEEGEENIRFKQERAVGGCLGIERR